MSSIRLRQDQIVRLRKSGCGPRCIAYALKRWRRGDFTITPAAARGKGANALQVYPIWRKPDGVTDAELRAVLDAHWATPDTVMREKLKREIAYWDGVIADQFAKLAAKGPFMIETTPQDGE